MPWIRDRALAKNKIKGGRSTVTVIGASSSASLSTYTFAHRLSGVWSLDYLIKRAQLRARKTKGGGGRAQHHAMRTL